MIPMRKNRKVRTVVNMTIYTLRNMVERVRPFSRTGGVHGLTQQTQEQPSAGNPLRKNRSQLPRLRRHSMHQALAPPFVNMTYDSAMIETWTPPITVEFGDDLA